MKMNELEEFNAFAWWFEWIKTKNNIVIHDNKNMKLIRGRNIEENTLSIMNFRLKWKRRMVSSRGKKKIWIQFTERVLLHIEHPGSILVLVTSTTKGLAGRFTTKLLDGIEHILGGAADHHVYNNNNNSITSQTEPSLITSEHQRGKKDLSYEGSRLTHIKNMIFNITQGWYVPSVPLSFVYFNSLTVSRCLRWFSRAMWCFY